MLTGFLEMIEIYLFAILAGVCSISAGGAFHKYIEDWSPISLKIPSQLTLALMLCHLTGWNAWTLTLCLWMPFARQVWGTGDPFGKMIRGHAAYKDKSDNLEKWQITDNAWWSVAMLGNWYVLPAWAYGIWLDSSWLVLPIIFAFTFPFAGLLGRKFGGNKQWMSIEFSYWFLTMLFFGLSLY
jgi:hypothetical protein